jgi:glycosyltransferase involved in cell wall biosynthesis
VKRLRIFIGPVEIGKIGGTLASAFREKEVKVTVVRNSVTPFQAGMKYNQTIQFECLNTVRRRFMKLKFFLKNFFRHDAFIFLFGKTLLSHNLDLPLYRLFHKKTLMWFLGSDIISYEAVERAKRNEGLKDHHREPKKDNPQELLQKMNMIRKTEKYVDYIIADPTIAHLLTKNYIGIDHPSGIHMPIDIVNIRFNNETKPIPIIIHAPTDDEKKGTAFIVEALSKLEKEGYKFDFRLCKNMSNLQVREILSEGDIAVDQLFSVAGGTFAVEAMAAGCVVLGGNIPRISGIYDLPILHTDSANVYDNLKQVLEKPEMRKDLGAKGRIYAEKYHNHKKVAEDILNLFSQAKEKKSN